MEAGPDGASVLREAYAVDEQGDCRFLDEDHKRCEVHAQYGVTALPDLCLDFPVAAFASRAGADFFFDPVCPAVLDRIVDDEGPVRIESVAMARADEAMRRRAVNRQRAPRLRLGVCELDEAQFDRIRRMVMASLENPAMPVWRHLHAIDAAFAELALGECDPDRFLLRYDRNPAPYLRYLERRIDDHHARTLERLWRRYHRFVFAIPREGPAFDDLTAGLDEWRPAYERFVKNREAELRPVYLRYLAHRYFAPHLKIDGELHFAPGAVSHLFATSLRYASALASVMGRPADRATTKVALGAAEFVHRWLELSPGALVLFGLDG